MRKSFVRRGATAALAVLGGLSATLLAASPAQAATPAIAGVTLSTSTVILDGDAGCGNRVKLTFKVYEPAGDESNPDLGGEVVAPDGDVADFLFPSLTSRSGDYAYYTDYVFLCGGLDTVGRYTVRTELEWWDENYDTHVAERFDAFTVKRPTSLTYNATPEPVKRNGTLTHTGVLKADPAGYGAKVGLKGAVLKFWFKANGAKAYAYKGQVTTGAGGKYSKKFKATKSGTWMVVYAGSSTRQPQTRVDAVKVK